jgi:MFS family permease
MPSSRQRFYYGWVIVATGFWTMLLVQGTFSSSGVLLAALSQEYGWSRATTSLPFSVALVGYAATAWLAGRLFDLYGPRRLFPLGALGLGVGLIACTQAATPWGLCLTWGLVVGQSVNLIGFVPHLAQMALWFHRRRGLASGLLLSGASVGTLLVTPGAQYLVNQYGWQTAYITLGVLVIAGLVPLNAFLQQHRPADLGLYPDGAESPPLLTTAQSPLPTTVWTLRRALATPRFWYLFFMVACIGWLSNVTNVHQIAHIVGSGFPSLLAASVIGAMGLMRAAGSTVWGGLADRFGREGIYLVGTALCLAGLACLAVLSPASPVWLLYAFSLIYGVGSGVHGAIESTATADIFHGPHLGAILGVLELGWGLGGFLGAWGGGVWYDVWGSYHGVFVRLGFRPVRARQRGPAASSRGARARDGGWQAAGGQRRAVEKAVCFSYTRTPLDDCAVF